MFEISSFVLIQVLISICCYFLISFTKEFGKQQAININAQNVTRIIESVKTEFGIIVEKEKNQLDRKLFEEIEIIKSKLSKDNIQYQISYGELIRAKIINISDFYASLYELKNYFYNNLFYYEDQENFKNKSNEFFSIYNNAEKKAFLCFIFFDEDTNMSIRNILDNIFSSYMNFKLMIEARNSLSKGYIPKMVDLEDDSLNKLDSNLKEIPILLEKIRQRFNDNIKA